MGLFDVNYGNGIWQNIPVMLRDNVMYSWLKVVCSPMTYVYNLFTANRSANLYNLSHNGQVCYLEGALNDLFDNTLRRIYIGDGPYDEAVYVFLEAEEHPVYLDLVSEEGTGVIDAPDPVPLYCKIENAMDGVAFIVNVPTDVEGVSGYSEARLRKLVDMYRLPSKGNYTIVYF